MKPDETTPLTRHGKGAQTSAATTGSRKDDGVLVGRPLFVSTGRTLKTDASIVNGRAKRIYAWVVRHARIVAGSR